MPTEEDERYQSDATNKLTSQLKLLSRKRHQKSIGDNKAPAAKLDVNANKKSYEEKRALSRMYQKKFIERRERQVQHINRLILNETK